MKSIKRYLLLSLSLTLIIIIMSACGSSTASNLTPQQIVQNSTNTMKNLKTSHFALNVTLGISGVNITGVQTPTNVNGMQAPSTITVTLNGSGDQSIPQKQQKLNFTMHIDSTSILISEIITGDKVYIKTPKSPWYSIDKSAYAQFSSSISSSLSTFTGTNIEDNNLLAFIGSIKVTDHGDESVNGLSLRHITANMDKAALGRLLASDPQLKSEFGSQDLNSMLDFNASVDVYIDESQFYLHSIELKVSYKTNTKGTVASTNLDLTTSLSNFNQPVTIAAPANSSPLTDPNQLLGS